MSATSVQSVGDTSKQNNHFTARVAEAYRPGDNPENKMISSTQPLQKTKQIIIVNGMLKLSTEKLVTHLQQASAGAFRAADANARKMWLVAGRPKVIARTLGEDDFYDLLSRAQRRRLPFYRVGDGTLGIGPVCEMQIDQLTMLLDLYGWVRQNALNKVSLR